jgi:hypothetical protein
MSTSFAVKSVFQEDCRRFKLEKASFESLRQALLAAYPQLTDEFAVKYTDDEGDLCLITADMELAEAVHVAELQKSPLKVQVFATKLREIPDEKKLQSREESPKSSPPPDDVEIIDVSSESEPELVEVEPIVTIAKTPEPVSPVLTQARTPEPVAPVSIPVASMSDDVKNIKPEEQKPEVASTPVPAPDEVKKELNPSDVVDLALSVLQDRKIQPDIPRAIETALDALRAGIEQGHISCKAIVDKVLGAFSSIKENPSVQKLLPYLNSWAPRLDNLLEKSKNYLPFIVLFIQQSISQIPQLLADIDFGCLKQCLLTKWERYTQSVMIFITIVSVTAAIQLLSRAFVTSAESVEIMIYVPLAKPKTSILLIILLSNSRCPLH